MMRRLPVFLLLPLILLSPPSRAASPAADYPTFKSTVEPFFSKYCLDCHDETKKGDIRLDQFSDEKSLVANLAALDQAAGMLRKHAMPPRKKAQPSAEELQPVLSFLDAFIARMDRELPPNPGRVVIRRLNRAEYNNTVRDLLGVDFHPADDFPPDDTSYGFDTIGATLSMNPTLMEKYLAAAEKVANTAVFGPEKMAPERVPHEPFFTADAFSKNTKVLFDYDETGMSLASALHVTQRFAVTGQYRLRTIIRGFRPAGSTPPEISFWIDGTLAHTATLHPPRGGEMNGQWAEFETTVPAGQHWLSVTIPHMYEGLPKAYKGPKPSEVQGSMRIGVDAWFPMYLDVIGPYDQLTGPSPDSLKKIFTCGHAPGHHTPDCARTILADLARRAYRRPVEDREVDALVDFANSAQHDGESFEQSICLAIERLLVSPNFLFRVEKAPPADSKSGARPINQFELASRLSYFLWSSMPDEELFRCAANAELRDPQVLEAQIRRMLKDPKVAALVENFGGQWLQTRALESHTPDRVKFSQFTDYTRMSMKQETDLFFRYIIAQDRPILDFLDADYTFLNQRLAEFYGIPRVKGHEFRKVDLTNTSRRGVLTQASVLTVSSYANRTSPVLRGKWILENLLNAPPPPPPPDVPSLNESAIGKSVSLREQLEKHRSNPTCAACHARMDPLGFALEHFDAIGQWRDRDGKFDIQTAGVLPDGRSFKDYKDLQSILTSDPRDFTECLAEKMLIYALGRGLETYDRTAIRAIADSTARHEQRFSSLVLAIVNSVPFQMQKTGGD